MTEEEFGFYGQAANDIPSNSASKTISLKKKAVSFLLLTAYIKNNNIKP
jgi:hypothetical protein